MRSQSDYYVLVLRAMAAAELPALMKQVVVHTLGNNFRESAHIVQVPVPSPGPGQALVRTRSV